MDYTAILGERLQRCFDARSHFLRDRLVWQLLLLPSYGRFCHMTPAPPPPLRAAQRLRGVLATDCCIHTPVACFCYGAEP